MGIISSVIDFGGSLVNASSAKKRNREMMDFEREEAEKQREWSEQQTANQNAWNLEMWNKTNEYNNPTNQLQRLRDAGLNPLYFGLDGSSAGGLTSAQPLGYERAKAPNLSNPVEAGLEAHSMLKNLEKDMELKDAQIGKIKSETKAIDAKLPFEVEGLKNQVRNSSLDADAKETVNKYLDQQQQAELRLKNANADEADAMVQKAYGEIEKMDYEKTTMMIGWLETQEKILTLQKQRDLTDVQMKELASLISVNNQTAKKIGLDVSNYDDITVIGTASHNMKLGPVSIQEGQPITLAMKKAAEEHAKQLKEDKKKNKRSSEGSVSSADGSEYNGPIYD